MVMKYLFFLYLFCAISLRSEAQTGVNVNKPVSSAEQATLALDKVYGFSGDQMKQVLGIEEARLRAIAEIAPLKGSDTGKYLSKRQSAYEDAERAIYGLLNEGQRAKYQTQARVRENAKQTALGLLMKQGLGETEARNRLAETDLF